MKSLHKILILLPFLPLSLVAKNIDSISFSAFSDLYFAKDFATKSNQERPNFVYNHKKEQSLDINLMLVRGQFQNKNWRANLGLMAGSYANYNLSQEPNGLKHLFDANVSRRLSNIHNLWLQAGIFSSHIGFESAISSDCWTLTRSIMAENSPYYESGLHLQYKNKNEKWLLAFLVLNGWQRININPAFSKPSVGLQIQHQLNKKILLNYSNFIGWAQPDSQNTFRNFHNSYLQFQYKKNAFVVAFDIGNDKSPSTGKYAIWYTAVLNYKRKITNKASITARAEYYHDLNQIMINTVRGLGMKTWGASCNTDFELTPKILWRLETKYYWSSQKIFGQNEGNNLMLTTNISFRF